MYSFGLEFYLFSHCWCIWTIKYGLSFGTGSVILVLMALITYWNKKNSTLSGRSTVLYWRSVTKNTSVHAVNNQLLLENCCKSLKTWQSLWLLNDCFECFVLVPILINHVMKQLQNIYLILLKDLVLQIFKFCWISGEFQIQRRSCTVGFLIFFLHADGTMGFPTRLCHSIFFFFRNLGIVREL